MLRGLFVVKQPTVLDGRRWTQLPEYTACMGAARMALCVDFFDIKRMALIREIEGGLRKRLARPREEFRRSFYEV